MLCVFVQLGKHSAKSLENKSVNMNVTTPLLNLLLIICILRLKYSDRFATWSEPIRYVGTFFK